MNSIHKTTLPEYSLLFKCHHMLATVKLVSITHQIKKHNMVDSLVLVFLFTWLDLCGCVMLANLIQCYVLKTVLNIYVLCLRYHFH